VALPFAVPFAFCGLILGLLLSDPRLPTERIYSSDLVGSAVGAFAVIPAIAHLGVERSALGGCAVMLGAAVLLAPPRRLLTKGVVVAAAAVILVCVARFAWVFDLTYPDGSMLAQIQQLPKPFGIEYTAWDPVTRIEVSRIQAPDPETLFTPSLIGGNHVFHERFRRMLTQNNWAFTYAVDYDGNPDSLRGIEETVYSSAYQATSVARPRVLVIGVGGGFDVLTALHFQASEVTGVEVNAAIVDVLTRVYRDYFRSWVGDPRLRLINAEGRHYLATTPAQYDVIQLSGVDSYSGTPAAAHVFSESYLYTREAFDLYLSRLSPQGILSMMRVEFVLPADMLRALVMATGALRRAGVERPEEHIVMLGEPTGHYVALLVKKSPFTPAELARLAAWVEPNPFLRLKASPGHNDPEDGMYQRFLALGDAGREAAFVRSYPLDISPAEDDRPFFFRNSFWWQVFSPDAAVRQYVFPFMEYTILTLLAVIGGAAALCVYLPLRLLAAKGRRVPHAWRYSVFFAAIGLGYLAIEVALLQRFGLFLGHPNYALSVVLASLLLATGLGSLSSRAMVSRLGGLRFVAYLLGGLVLAEHLFVFPHLAALLGLPFPIRTAIAVALIAPIGLSLGTFFPTALAQIKGESAAFVPWAWGLNGIFSVLAPVLSVGLSMTWGIGALLLSGVPIYLLAGLVLPRPTGPLGVGPAPSL
jgi:hypothetical protein